MIRTTFARRGPITARWRPQSRIYQGFPAVMNGPGEAANQRPAVTVTQVADHIDHVARVAGHDHVGIGADLDGIPYTPTGLEGVETYPRLFAELIRRGWSDANLAKLAGGNVLRALRGAEATAAAMRDVPPALDKQP